MKTERLVTEAHPATAAREPLLSRVHAALLREQLGIRIRPLTTWLALGGSMLITLALYGRSLDLALLFDDTFDLTRVEGRSYWSLLSSSEGYSYYRPVPFLLWKALRSIQGYYDQTTLHLLPLLAHAFAGWFLFLLIRRLGAGLWALFPALLFLTYPFHYQNVPIVGTLFHPLAGAAILGSLTLYHIARLEDDDRRIALHAAALVVTTIALWSHESGIVIAPLMLGLELAILWNAQRWRPSPWIAGHLGLAVLFFIAWNTVEKTPFGEQAPLAQFAPKAFFFLQGFTYPLAAQLDWLRSHLGIPFGVETGLSLGILDIGLLAIALSSSTYLVAWWRTRRKGFALIPVVALGVAIVASAPSMARLSWPYVENSPRLLYLVGVASALFWGLLPLLRFGDRRLTAIWRAITITSLLLVVGQSWRFVELRMDMFASGTATIDEIVAIGENYQGRKIVVVNAPSWFSLDRYEYPYGHFGVQLMPSYIGLDRVIYTSSQRSASVDAASVTWNPDRESGLYGFGPHGPDVSLEQLDELLREGREVVTVYPAGAVYDVRDVGRLVPGGAEPELDLAGMLGDDIRLGYARASAFDDRLTIYFDWHVLDRLREDYETIVEVRDEQGDIIWSQAAYALEGYSPPRLWQVGDRIDDSVAFDVPDDGRYTVWAGLQEAGGDDRAPATSSDGQARDGLVMIGSIVVNDGQVSVTAEAR